MIQSITQEEVEKQRAEAERQARYQTRKALLLQLYSLEDVMVIYGDLAPENTIKAIKEKVKNAGS